MTELEKKLTDEVEFLKERIRLLERMIFAPKSEKIKLVDDGLQAKFSFEPETKQAPTPEAEPAKTEVKSHNRRKKGKSKLPEHLPVIEKIFDIPDAEKVCACGCTKTRIGSETSQQLQYVPSKFVVINNIRLKYSCPGCEGVESEGKTVSIAPVEPQIIPKSFATPSLLAHIIVSKFADALPFYRQSKIFLRSGIELNRSTMCNWTIRVAVLLDPMIELLIEMLLQMPVIGADETGFQVLKEENRSPQAKSQMWAFRGGGEKPIILFKYNESRAGKVADEFLKGYKGYIQTDGYSGYGFIHRNQGQIRVGCWAHCRRKFHDSIKAAGKGVKDGIAHEAIAIIKRLYEVEREAVEKCLIADEIIALRHEKAKPILDFFKQKLEEWEGMVPKKSLTGKAVTYAKNQWQTLIKYLDDGRLKIDNNGVENAIRPVALGRKIWMFADTVEGAEAAATLFSIIETAKANGLEPFWYLMFLLTELPKLKNKADFLPFLPQNIKKSLVEDLMQEALGFSKNL